MSAVVNEVVNLIEMNKISTTEVGDVLGKTGQIEGVKPLNHGLFKVGEVAFAYAINNSNYELHKQISEMDLRDKVLFVYNVNCDRAIFGDLVSKYILLYKRAKAIVVNGLLRDGHSLLKENYPIWCIGLSPIGCVNHPNGEDMESSMLEKIRQQYEGGVMVCDDSGVVLIPKKKIDEQLYNKLEFIEIQEDVWYYCLDTLKMSTFDIVCKKKYLEEGVLDSNLLMKLKKYQ